MSGVTMLAECGPKKLGDSQEGEPRLGNQGELVCSDFNGQFFEHMLRGNLFMYHTPAQALLLTGTTGNFPTVWNPAGSGYLFVPLALRLSFVSGTTTIGSVLIAESLQVGSNIGTAAPIPTATFVAPKNALRGSAGAGMPRGSAMLWAPSAITFTAAPAVVAATGLNLGAAAPTGTGSYEVKLDSAIGYPPGTAMSIVYSVTTSTALFFATVWGLELPLPLTA